MHLHAYLPINMLTQNRAIFLTEGDHKSFSSIAVPRYDLEHLGDEDEIQFYVNLSRSLKPDRVLELACGTGRITIPLAEEGRRSGYSAVGLDTERCSSRSISRGSSSYSSCTRASKSKACTATIPAVPAFDLSAVDRDWTQTD
jgi:SAM-dependent methyltransferase